MTTITKKQVSAAQFEKEVEVSAAYLMHENRNLSKEKADKIALEETQKLYEIVKPT